MEYDVFISCKSEDYIYAEEIYDFLAEKGINAFIASKELRNLGDSEYRRAISKVMKSAQHIIVFASKAEYVDSTWVYYEWDMFLTAKLKGFKEGQIMTILKDITVDDINMELWKYESFTINNYKEKILAYVETPQYLKRREEADKKLKEEYEMRRRMEKQEEDIREAKALVVTLAEDYRKRISEIQSVDVPRIINAMEKAQKSHRICPICGNKIAIRSSFCNKCSWGISPLEGIEEVSYLNVYDSEHLRFAKERYLQQVSSEAKIKELTEMVESKKSADQSNIEYQKILKKQDDEIQTYKRSLTQANDMVRQLRGLLEDQKRMFANEIETYINAISNKDAELTALQNKYRDYRNSLDVDRFKGTFNRTTPQKISEKIIPSIISECSAYPGITFSPGDALRRIGFNSKLCEQLLESRYNVHLSQKSLSTCLTVSDLHAMIRKACEVGSI